MSTGRSIATPRSRRALSAWTSASRRSMVIEDEPTATRPRVAAQHQRIEGTPRIARPVRDPPASGCERSCRARPRPDRPSRALRQSVVRSTCGTGGPDLGVPCCSPSACRPPSPTLKHEARPAARLQPLETDRGTHDSHEDDVPEPEYHRLALPLYPLSV